MTVLRSHALTLFLIVVCTIVLITAPSYAEPNHNIQRKAVMSEPQPAIVPDRQEATHYYQVRLSLDSAAAFQRLSTFVLGLSNAIAPQNVLILADSISVLSQLGIPFEKLQVEAIQPTESDAKTASITDVSANICAYPTKQGNTLYDCSGTCNTSTPYFAGGVDMDCGVLVGTYAAWQFTNLPYNCAQTYTRLMVGFYGNGTGWPDNGASIFIYNWSTSTWVEIWSNVGTDEALKMQNAPDLIIGHYLHPTYHNVAMMLYASPTDCAHVKYVQCTYCYDEKNGTIHATSSPTGASITVDGVSRGTTTIDISIAPGLHTVTMSKSCYNSCTKTVTVTCAGTTNVDCALSPQYATIGFSSTPTGATVSEGGITLGTTPFTKTDVTPGAHTYSFAKNCYVTTSQSITVTCNTTYSLPCTLPPQLASVTFNSTPQGVIVRESGGIIGTTPFTKTDVLPGSHTYTASLQCYQDDSKSINACGGSQSVQFSLPAVTTTITFTSTPSGATVLEGGVTLGTTTFSRSDLTPGPHTFTFRLPGYLDCSNSKTIVCGVPQTIDCILTPCTGSISGKITAPNGTTPIQNVTVTASCAGNRYQATSQATGDYTISIPVLNCNPWVVTPSLGLDTFSPPSLSNCNLDCTNRTCSGQNFIDNSTKIVSGKILYSTCNNAPASGVAIYVDDQTSGQNTDLNGQYAVSVNLGPHKIRPVLSGHTFALPERQITVTDNVPGIDFTDETSVTIAGVCITSCGETVSGANVTYSSSACNGQTTTALDGSYSVTVPPGTYTLCAAKAPISFPCSSPMPITSNKTYNFVFLTHLKIVTSDPNTSCNAITKGEQWSYHFCIKDDRGCAVSGATVTITDDVSNPLAGSPTPQVRVLTGTDCFDYTITGGRPQIDKHLSISVSAGGYDNQNNEGLDRIITVTGRQYLGQTFVTQLASQTPVMILYDPPGDMSYSFMEHSSDLYSEFGMKIETEVGIDYELHAGVKNPIFTFQVAAGGRVAVSGAVGNRIGYRVSNTSLYETEHSVPDGEPLIKGPGHGTKFLTAGLNVLYGVASEITVNPSTCVASTQDVLGLDLHEDQSGITSYYNSAAQIERDVIPDPVLPPDQKSLWQQLLANDLSRDNAITPDEYGRVCTVGGVPSYTSRTWAGGGGQGESKTTEVSRQLSFSAQLEVEQSVATEFGLKVYGIGAGGKVKVSARITVGADAIVTTKQSNTIGYWLEDNESSDYFSTLVYCDAAFGVPVFISGPGSRSMCPWEQWTSKNEDIDLVNLSGKWDTTVCPGTPAVLSMSADFLGLLNGSLFRMYPSSNPCGAAVTFNGVPGSLENVNVVKNTPFSVAVRITPNSSCGNNSVTLRAESICDPQIYSDETIIVRSDPSVCPTGVTIIAPAASPPPDTGSVTIRAITSTLSFDGVRFYHQKLGSGMFQDCYDQAPVGTTTRTYQCIWQSRSWADGKYRLIAVPVIAGADKLELSDTVIVDIDNTCPRVSQVWPKSDSLYAGLIQVEFTELMDNEAMSCISGCVRIHDVDAGADISCQSVSHPSDLQYKFIPLSALPQEHHFEGIIQTCSRDLAGNLLCSEYRWPFTTVTSTPSPCPFVVTAYTPQSGLMKGQVTIAGPPADESDCVGAFDSKGNCCGVVSPVLAPGCTGQGVVANFSMQIYGNDPTTPDDEGMDPGELFTIRFFDASENKILTYPGTFNCWSNTNGAPLPAPCGDPCTIYDFPAIPECAIDVAFRSNWNLASFCSVSLDTAPSLLFAQLGATLFWVSGFGSTGYTFYDPSDPSSSTLTAVKSGQGYWIKTTTAASMQVKSSCLAPTFCLNMNKGWNLIGYWRDKPTIPQLAFASLVSQAKLIWVSGFGATGYVWWDPSDPIGNTLDSLRCGDAYWIKVTDAVSCFGWPQPPALAAADGLCAQARPKLESLSDLAPFVFVPNQQASLVSGQAFVDGIPATDEDLVAAFDEDGHCAGATRIETRNGAAHFALEVYGDDPTTSNIDEGPIPGEAFFLRLYDASSGELVGLEKPLRGWQNTNGSPLYIDSQRELVLQFSRQVRESNTVPRGYALEQNYPNPFNPATTIALYLEQSSQMELAIYNIVGQRVRTLISGVLAAGHHQFIWNGTDDQGNPMPSGIYFSRMISPQYRETKKLVFLR